MNLLLTGAASGLGRGLAMHFASAGHRLFLTDANAEGLRETLRLLGPAVDRAETHVLDVTSAEQIGRLFESLSEPIDLLINNAGLQHVARLEEFPEERWDRLLDVMLKGAFLMTRSVLPGMQRAGFGRIVNMGSIHSLIASPFKAAYTAAKHGLLGLTKTAALETADVDITVNAVCPSYIRTPLVDAQIAAQARERGISEAEVIGQVMLAPMPEGTFVTIEEVAATIEFLASHAARNITGQTIVIDGGWTAR